jgi:hypothetical protein
MGKAGYFVEEVGNLLRTERRPREGGGRMLSTQPRGLCPTLVVPAKAGTHAEYALTLRSPKLLAYFKSVLEP